MSCCGGKTTCNDTAETKDKHQEVSEYYSETIQSTQDLATATCCVSSTTAMPKAHRQILKKIHDEVTGKFYGCGSTIPPLVEGCTVLDLGCGTGRDIFLASALVGKEGRAIGIDMTEAQVEVANKHRQFHANEFLSPNTEPNTTFHLGKIEECSTRVGGPCEPNSVDVVVSNCVLNLAPDKGAVLASAFEVMKPGGELFFSDIYASRRVPEVLQGDKVLWGECLSGALYWNDFLTVMQRAGFVCVRRVDSSAVALEGDIGRTCEQHNVSFQSITVRAFKPAEGVAMEPFEEDFGQTATLVGELPDGETSLVFDECLTLAKDKPAKISSNEAEVLRASRYAHVLKIDTADRDNHRGPFTHCAPKAEGDKTEQSSGGGCCPPKKKCCE